MEQLQITDEDFRHLGQMLRKVDFFSNLTMADLDDVMKHIRLYEYRKNEKVFNEGESGDALFILFEGAVRIQRKRNIFLPEKVLSRLQPGQVFGEMSLLNQGPRSATAKATTPSKVFALLAGDFQKLCAHNPSFSREMNFIAEKRSFENKHAK